ncbi:MAG: FAD-linked oxidase [Pseudonocardiales bacterium]|nr:FAD-linked oxidase [Pseudonocardiales bacterium]
MTTAHLKGDSHADAVAILTASYAAVPPGQLVRLAKSTSNLFRTRSAAAGSAPGLDVSGLDGVISIDAAARTADVQGVCTYEHLVEATLPRGLMPLVVPQLKTITLGGAVTGLGIESTSFRNGLPHESVLEMDILTGSGRIVTASPTENADLFRAFPNSYGSLGYAVRLRIELEPVQPYVALRHILFRDLGALTEAIADISATRSHDGQQVDFLDGVMFDRGESYLTLGRFAASLDDAGATEASDYTGQRIYYRSIQSLRTDCLTIHDYLWRWDTDWFWCSAAFGAQNRIARRLWPRRLRRSDVYHRLVGLESRFGVAARIERWRGRPDRERVVQDVELPLDRTAEFLRWFEDNIGMAPVWLCPLALRPVDAQAAPVATAGDGPRWPLYPLGAGELYVNVGFWGTVAIAPGSSDGDVNRQLETAVAKRDGHKSLYSDAYYDRPTFEQMYGGAHYRTVKDAYDPDRRLADLYDKVVGRR